MDWTDSQRSSELGVANALIKHQPLARGGGGLQSGASHGPGGGGGGVCPVTVCMLLAAGPAPAYLRGGDAGQRADRVAVWHTRSRVRGLIDLHAVRWSLLGGAVLVKRPRVGKTPLAMRQDPRFSVCIDASWLQMSRRRSVLPFLLSHDTDVRISHCFLCTCHFYLCLWSMWRFQFS